MKILIGVLSLFVFILATVGVYYVWANPVLIHYKGKEVFNTEQAYNEFKQVVGSKDIEINDMLVLSSTLPIVVQYDITAFSDIDFPYGEHPTDDVVGTKVISGLLIGLGGLVGLFLLSLLLSNKL